MKAYNNFRIQKKNGRIWIEQLFVVKIKKRFLKKRLERHWLSINDDVVVCVDGECAPGNNLPSIEFAKKLISREKKFFEGTEVTEYV